MTLRNEAARVKSQAAALRKAVPDKASQLATAAFGLVTALACNGASQALLWRDRGRRTTRARSARASRPPS